MIAKIAVDAANFAIDKPYSYFVPQDMSLMPGMRVQLPFGRSNRRTEGVVLSIEDGAQDGLKAIDKVLDEKPVLSETMLRLAAFIRERCFCTFYDAIRTMLPAGLWFQAKDTFSLTDDLSWQDKMPRKPQALQILQFLKDCGGSADSSQLQQHFTDGETLEQTVAYLLRKKWIIGKTDYFRRTADKTEQVATLAVSGEEAMDFAAHRPKSAVMQRSVLELICSVGSASVKDICYYTGASPATVRRLAEMGYLSLSERAVLRCGEIVPEILEGPLVLNEQQQTAFAGLSEQMQKENPGAALLYGITGSGKTSVYIQLIRKCLDSGK